MRELVGRVAVVTGGGSGIGRGMALAFADAGMHVAIADIEAPEAEKVADEVRSHGVRAVAVETDVVELDAVRALADTVWRELGNVHVVCNNAGVAVFGWLIDGRDSDWEWVLGVNLKGVANGVQVFLPRLRDQGGEGHIVNTASMAGLIAPAGLGIYSASKYAVVAITETLRAELGSSPLSCSVLCPGVVNTNIRMSERNRPKALGESVALDLPESLTLASISSLDRAGWELAAAGKDPLEVGRMVRQGVIDDDLYIFPHPDARVPFEERTARIASAFGKWEAWADE